MAMELVALPEAAQRLGVSVDTVKRKLRRGELRGQRVPRPQGYTWLIELPDSQMDSMADCTASSMAELGLSHHRGTELERDVGNGSISDSNPERGISI